MIARRGRYVSPQMICSVTQWLEPPTSVECYGFNSPLELRIFLCFSLHTYHSIYYIIIYRMFAEQGQTMRPNRDFLKH